MSHLLLTIRLAPYSRDSDDWSAFLADVSILITMLLGFLLVRFEAQSMEENDNQVIAFLLVIFNSLCMIGQVLILVFWDIVPMMRQKQATVNGTQVVPRTAAAQGEENSPEEVESSKKQLLAWQ